MMTADTPPFARSRLFWKLQAAGWGCQFLLVVVFSFLGQFPWREALLLGFCRTLIGFLLTSGLRLWFMRLPRPHEAPWRLVFPVVLGGIAAGTLDTLVMRGFLVFFDTGAGAAMTGELLTLSPMIRSVLYVFWSVLYFGINHALDTQDARLRLAQAEAAARTGELQALRAQINPHFLFNALGSLLAEAENPALVRKLTHALADYLRFSLEQHGDRAALGRELDALENYLRVEKIRFEEMLDYRIEADASARRAQVPGALVQPLLENAIKYGQRSPVRPLRVRIEAEVKQGILWVEVRNSGAWIAPDSTDSPKTGLANLTRRLELLYGARADLRVEKATNIDGGEVRVRVRLPLAEEAA